MELADGNERFKKAGNEVVGVSCCKVDVDEGNKRRGTFVSDRKEQRARIKEKAHPTRQS
jgi:hypothetical protein